MPDTLDKAAAIAALLPPWATDVLPSIRAGIPRNCRKLWILDDDPTGTQTIAGLPVITDWGGPTLQAEFNDPAPACFVLTNSRGLTAARSRELHEQFMHNVREAAGQRSFGVVSRGDSTLRGHYPLETDIIAAGTDGETITLLAPYFAAGGRYTLNDTHFVAEGDTLVPAGRTPFARDTVFGYRASHLPSWVAEKTGGTVAAEDVVCLSLDLIRKEGPSAVGKLLRTVPNGGVVVANAVDQSDIEVVVAGVLDAETAGKRVVARTAASYVCARVGQRPPPLLEGAELINVAGRGGLTLVGSHVPKTTAQLDELKGQPEVVSIELDVTALLEEATRQPTIDRTITQLNEALAADRDTVLHTSRQLIHRSGDNANLSISAEVSRALCDIVSSVVHTPRYLIAKGGITSSDTATRALGVKRAMVTGQILPGVPVWRLGEETRFPGLSYIIFPGNVGDNHALAAAVSKLKSAQS